MPASLMLIYIQGKYTFDLGLVSDLLNFGGFMVMVVFPAYAVFYAVLLISNAAINRMEYNKEVEWQARKL
jgi:hypothetical protein